MSAAALVIARVRPGRARRVPFVPQTAAADCGAACLAMALAHHGRRPSLEELRLALGTGRDGASALALLRAASRFGLAGRGVRAPRGRAELLRPASVLHWEGRHFVVLERASARRVTIVDPALGRRALSREEFAAGFTGLALELWPAAGAGPRERAAPSPALALLRASLRASRVARPFALVSALLLALAVGSPLLIAALVDSAEARAAEELPALGAAALVTALLLLAASWTREALLQRLRARLDDDLSRGTVSHLLRLPWSYFLARSSADLALRLQQLAGLRQRALGALTSLVADGALVLVYLAALCAWSWRTALLALALAGAQVAVLALSSRALARRASTCLSEQARAQGFVARALAGIQAIKAAGAEAAAGAHWGELHARAGAAESARDRLLGRVDALLSTLRAATPLSLVYFGAAQVVGGEQGLGAMLGSTYLALAFLAPGGALCAAAGQLPGLAAGLARVDDILRAAPEPVGGAAPAALRGALELAGVGFRYGAEGPWALREVSLSIAPGQRVAIVGASGAGKSTLAALLLGLLRPTEGALRFDGRAVAELDPAALRARIGAVTQQAALLDATIRENIAFGAGPVGQAQIEAAAADAAVHAEISALPLGYETPLVDGGAGLSGGQRQRIALARALVRGPALVLLDEATSALDPETEAKVLAALRRRGCTVIAVAHRASLAADADLVVLLDAGRVVAQGSHAALSASCPRYRALLQLAM